VGLHQQKVSFLSILIQTLSPVFQLLGMGFVFVFLTLYTPNPKYPLHEWLSPAITAKNKYTMDSN
jgi:hypothetical protein